eukprot:404557_1
MVKKHIVILLINNNRNQVILMNKVAPKMERILEALSGAVILTTFSSEERCDCKLMRDETLLLIDVLCVNDLSVFVGQLIETLLCIHVIYLSLFVVSWIGCLFVSIIIQFENINIYYIILLCMHENKCFYRNNVKQLYLKQINILPYYNRLYCIYWY